MAYYDTQVLEALQEIARELKRFVKRWKSRKKRKRGNSMVTAHFNAFCPLEIGDEIRDMTGRVHTITDIACVHYVRTGKVEFRFELDRSGRYAPIEVQDAPPEVRVRLIQK